MTKITVKNDVLIVGTYRDKGAGLFTFVTTA